MADNAESSLEECSLKHYIYEIDVFYKILCKIQENIVKESPLPKKKKRKKEANNIYTDILEKHTRKNGFALY